MPHVFQAFAGNLEEAGDALDRAALFLQQHLPRTTTPTTGDTEEPQPSI